MHSTKKNITKLLLVITLSTAGFVNSFAQFDGQFTQYMNNMTLVNPAYVGGRSMMQISIFQRTQWIGMQGAPIVSMLSADMPFKLFGKEHGVGLHITSDIFGVFNNQQVRFMYAYKHKFNRGYLNLAVNLGMVNVICRGDSININRLSSDDGYHTDNDPAIPTGKQTGMGFDAGLGVAYVASKYNVGISATHLTSPAIPLGDRVDFKVLPLLQIHGGYDIDLTSKKDNKYRLRTNMLVITDFISWTSSLSAVLDVKKRFWIGLGYRLQDAVSIMAGVKIFEGFRLGYTFDLPVNTLITKTFGSHEVFVSYEFALSRERSKSSKSIRIL